MRGKLKKILLWGTAAVVLLPLILWVAQPWPIRLRWHDPETTSFMRYREREAREAGETLEIRHVWVPLEQISDRMERAVILAEDGNFREHGGVDWGALGEELRYDGEPPFSLFHASDLAAVLRALRYYRDNRDEVRGRSTITQQLAKNLYFTPERSLGRKLAELVVAQRLEWFLSKDRILELYLNTVELGPGVFGVEAAAQEYFGRSAAELSAYQAASLAGTLPHPLTSNPGYRPSRMAWRRDLILGRMGGGVPDTRPVPVAPVEPPDPVVLPEPAAVPAADAPVPVPPPTDPDAPPGGEPLPVPPSPAPAPAPSPPDTVGVGALEARLAVFGPGS